MLTVENVKIYPKLDFYFENIELKIKFHLFPLGLQKLDNF